MTKKKIDPIDRLYQIFSARLVLEVFGGGGAIWGFSEVVTLRNPDTVWFWRPCAFIFGCIFCVRFICQIVDFITELTKGPIDRPPSTKRLFQIFSAKLVLEVFGAGGAIWGSTEALTLRVPETQEFWRNKAIIVAIIFTIRFFMQIRDFREEMNSSYSRLNRPSSNDEKNWTRLVQIFSARFVLEVLGGAGAIWGFSEVLTIRNPETVWFWRPCALTIGSIFFYRWVLQIIDFVSEIKGTIGGKESLRLLQVFGARIVLEVFGGGGAIWGFSEVVTLRNPNTVWFWRPCAATFGFIFFVRFCLQIKDFIDEYKGCGARSRASFSRMFQIFSAKLVLEVFGAGGAIWGFSESLTLRNPQTQEFWRNKAIIVAVIFTFRYFLQMKDYTVEIYNEYMGISNEKPKPTGMQWVRLLQIFSARLVLEVFGGAGAIWGFSEVLTLRVPATLYFWRPTALIVGFIFFMRWMMQIKDFINECMGGSSYLKLSTWCRLFQIFTAKLVLEVFGGGGAIWGFSEVLTLRTPATVWFWRPCAATVGAIFFARFILQIKDYMEEIEKEKKMALQKMHAKYTDIAAEVNLVSETTPLYGSANSAEP
mmetsp:Transcript_36800/g.85958  ORF Transcript_36800/g.85958 Transcript_36800/m.85958 type:complete len:592 (-) Transcript_36800:119-1894(-)